MCPFERSDTTMTLLPHQASTMQHDSPNCTTMTRAFNSLTDTFDAHGQACGITLVQCNIMHQQESDSGAVDCVRCDTRFNSEQTDRTGRRATIVTPDITALTAFLIAGATLTLQVPVKSAETSRPQVTAFSPNTTCGCDAPLYHHIVVCIW